MSSQRLVYIDGELVPEGEAKISVFDSAVLIGDSIQEVCRTFKRKLFRWPDHRNRMLRSIKAARLDFPMPAEELDRVTEDFLQRNLPTLAEREEAGVGHLVSRGRLGLVLPPTTSTFVMYFYPMSTFLWKTAKYYRTGRHVVTPLTRHMHPLTMDPKIKYRSRLHFSLADQEARLVDPEAIPLMLDHEGNLAEGTGWNFFLVRDGAVLTPTPRNILAGISRLTTIELARSLGLEMKECDLTPYDAATADELFYTATSICIMPVTRFNGQTVGDGKPGPVTRRLMDRWKEYLDFDFEAHAEYFLEA
ncbi:MAG: aminotransferase class IV [Bryobacteraceae bacterium]